MPIKHLLSGKTPIRFSKFSLEGLSHFVCLMGACHTTLSLEGLFLRYLVKPPYL